MLYAHDTWTLRDLELKRGVLYELGLLALKGLSHKTVKGSLGKEHVVMRSRQDSAVGIPQYKEPESRSRS